MLRAFAEFLTPLSSYPSLPGATLAETLSNRVAIDPFGDGISPLYLFLGALGATLIATMVFRLL